MSCFFATFLYVGLLPVAPGTWGSAAAIPVALLIHWLGGSLALAIAAVLITLVGWWATADATRDADNHDPGEIVIDEVAGMFIALLPVSLGAAHSGVGMLQLFPGIIAAFLLFRLFDILKPGPVGWADKRNDALGVMLDDVIAGVMAAFGVGILAWLSHGVLEL